jgi:hypothetical protein
MRFSVSSVSDTFLSASDDGTVRQFDVRERPVGVHGADAACNNNSVLGESHVSRSGYL